MKITFMFMIILFISVSFVYGDSEADFEGNLSSCSYWKIYKWGVKNWVIKKEGPMLVS